MALKWYIIHVYSGFENKVKATLEERIASSPHADKFGEIVVPTEEIVELVKGKRKTSARKFYPGYILVQIDLDDSIGDVLPLEDFGQVTGSFTADVAKQGQRSHNRMSNFCRMDS